MKPSLKQVYMKKSIDIAMKIYWSKEEALLKSE